MLFCDLVGSTALSEQLDPEDFGSVIRVYLEHCAAAITRCGGHVASYTGDGVLAYFGYPQAREDAAERAVRAGLAIVEATDDLKPDPDLALQLRAGIATGLVVNDQVGGSAQGQVTVGKPLNLAARLRRSQNPGRWSSPTARGASSASCSPLKTWAASRSEASPRRCRLGG